MKWYKLFDTMEEAKQAVPPLQARLVLADELRVCLAHGPDGLRAVADACPHLGVPLSRGKVNYLGEIVCPWHSYRYNLANGQECEERSASVKKYVLEAREDGIYLGIP